MTSLQTMKGNDDDNNNDYNTDDMLMMKLMTILPMLAMWLLKCCEILTLGMNDDYEIILRL